MTPLDPDLQKSADRDPDQGGKMIKNNNFLTKNIIFKSEPKKNRYLLTAVGRFSYHVYWLIWINKSLVVIFQCLDLYT